MNKKHLNFILSLILLLIGGLVSCTEETKDLLSVSRYSFSFQKDGGVDTLVLQTSASEWTITNNSDWVEVTPSEGTGDKAIIEVSVSSRTLENRTAELKINAGNADAETVVILQSASDYLYEINCSVASIDYKQGGKSTEIKFSTDAPQWDITSDVDWLSISQQTGAAGAFAVSITASPNLEEDKRTGVVTISTESSESHEISITQSGNYFDDFNTNPLPPDMEGMESTATQLAANMGIGWNLGNTLEAIGGETAWGNPMVTEDMIKLVKANGFNSIRIPCSWYQYSKPTTAVIDETWLARVKEIVGYCVANDMYAVLNIHWDGGWLENNCTPDWQDENNARQKAFWQQIATYLRDFDEHLIFAGANEPNVENSTQMEVLLSYHQTFIDAVRSTGGKNAYRTLIVQGPYTDIEKTNNLMKSLPIDTVADRMMAEVHYYSPYQFSLMGEDADWGKVFHYWGEGYHSETNTDRNANWGEEDFVIEMMELMNEQFVQKGIPVILGEFGAVRRSTLTGADLELHLDSRAYYHYVVTKKCVENGIVPFYWDNGGMGNLGFALFDRSAETVFDQQVIDAMVKAGNLEDF
jgi:endoglucanase